VSWLTAFFANVGGKILKSFILFLFGRLVAWAKEQQEEAERKRINKINLEKYKKAIEEKLPDEEISKAGENLLNGITPNS